MGYSESAPRNASVRSIRFDFYNGELYKMVVTYNPVETNGLTAQRHDRSDFLEVRGGNRAGRFCSVSDSTTYEDQEKVLARWDNEQYSYNLYRSSYGDTFGLVAFSKMLDLKARDASHEADSSTTGSAPQGSSRSGRK